MRDEGKRQLEARPEENPRVTSLSQWSDRTWLYPAASSSRLVYNVAWDYFVGDGKTFSDDSFEGLREALRALTHGLGTDPQEGVKYQGPTLHSHSYFWRDFVRWMYRNDFSRFSQITSKASWMFLEDWLERNVDEEAPEITSTCRSLISTLRTMWRQRPVLHRDGYDCFEEAPFDDLSASEILRRVGGRANRPIPSFPDEVALPVLAAAVRMVGTPATDVINLVHEMVDMLLSTDLTSVSTAYNFRKVLFQYSFSVIPGESEPWRANLAKSQDEFTIYGYEAEVRPLNTRRTLSRLIGDVRGACSILVQGLTGVRISELGSIDGRWDKDAPFPACISVRASESGLNELFFVKGTVVKERAKPEDAEWLIGMRPRSSDYVPLPVHAICVLYRLYAPWREHEHAPAEIRSHLFLHPGRGFRVRSGYDWHGLRPARLDNIRVDQRMFVARYVDLSDLPDTSRRGESLVAYRESRGIVFKTSQWRKSFAQYIWRVDSRMLPAISKHFKHLSLTVTENAYIGNDPGLLGELDSQRRQTTAQLFRKWSRGEPMAAGQMKKRLALLGQSGSQTIELSNSDEDVLKLVDLHNIKIFFSEHGHCFITADPLAARCHQVGDTTSWANSSPNYAHREPSVCIACPCYYIDEDHRDFWKSRHDKNEQLAAATGIGSRETRKIAKARLIQAKQVLRLIGAAEASHG